ncbi:MAG TPA: Rieske 2Fe-2S domain-containing protein [Acidimicrobiia bacterium]|nr:Rieske 2Fe-2S domain-containing protein [Acidimicrobiia bacterium]
MTASPWLLLWTSDPKVVRSVETLAPEAGLAVRRSDAGSADNSDPAVVVLDLDAPGAFDALVDVRGRWPESLVAGHLGVPDRDRWLAAERAGCDVVANRGALGAALRKRLASGAPRRGRRVPLLALADAAGRLGCVHREAAGGAADEPLAVYHVGSRFLVCADRCPHAGATLSEGELEHGVVTCPRHGSQFDVTTGQRVRGPADTDIATYPTVEDGGQLYLLVADDPT